jgi:outer membrane protein assembly factor BamB
MAQAESVVGRRHLRRTVAVVAVASILLLASFVVFRSDLTPSAGAHPGPARVSNLIATNAFDWPELHGTAQLSGYTVNTTLSTANASSLGVRWATDLYSAALDSPVVAYDPTLGETLAYIGTESGGVLGVDLANGAIVWGDWFGSPIRVTPVVYDGAVYVGTFQTPALYKLDTTTGAVDCRTVIPMEIEGTPTIATPPGGVATVYLGTEDTSAASGPFMAVNAQTCAIEWEFTGYNQTAGSWTPASYAVDAHGVPLVIFGTSDPDSSVYALNAVTGKEVWRFQSYNPSPGAYDVGAGAVLSSPGVNGFADGVAYVPSKYGIMYALDLTTGAEIWSTNFNAIAGVTEGGRSTPALDGTNLVFGYNGGLFDLDALTGAVEWQYTDSTHTEIISAPAIIGTTADAVVAAGDVAGNFDVVSLATGTLLYHYETGGYISASPAVSNGSVLIASSDGFLYDFAVGGGNLASLPVTGVTAPTQGSQVANPSGDLVVTGTASDSLGVSGVRVAIQTAGSSGPWWDSSTAAWVAGPFANSAHLASPGATSTAWSFTYPVPRGGGVYSLSAYAVSTGGQSDIHGPLVGFTVLESTKGPHLKVSPGAVAPGASVTLTGGGFTKSESINFTLDGTVLGSVNASSTGSVPATKVKVPSKTPFGLNALDAIQSGSGKNTTAAITIENSWEQTGVNAGHTNFDANDPTLNDHVYLGKNTWLYEAWQFSPETQFLSSPSIANGVLYAADGSGDVYAIDTANGGLLWTYTFASSMAIYDAPAVDPTEGLVFVATSSGTIAALSSSTGAPVWSASPGGNLSAPVYGSNDVFLTSSTGTVSAYAEASGSLVWSTTVAGVSLAAPTVDTTAHRLFIGTTTGHVLELSAATGAQEWSFTTSGAVTAAITLYDGSLYFGTNGGTVYSLSEPTGALLWSYSVGSPITVGGTFLTEGVQSGHDEYAVGAASGRIDVLRASTGTVDFSVTEKSAIVGLGSVDGIIAFETASGTAGATRGYTSLVIWDFTTPGGLASAPVIVDGAIYLATENGNLYAFTTFGQPPD